MRCTIAVILIALVSALPARAAGADSTVVAAIDPSAVLVMGSGGPLPAVHASSAAADSRSALLPPLNVRVAVSWRDGLVSVMARNATLCEILDAWARAGDTAIVNAECATTTPLTLDLVDVPEEEALALLLRSMSGYVAVPRSNARTGVSHFARIVILPMSGATTVAQQHSTADVVSPETTLPSPPPETMVNGVTRLIGWNGLPVEDDQQKAPPRTPHRSPPPPGAAAGSAVPGMVPPQLPQAQPTAPR